MPNEAHIITCDVLVAGAGASGIAAAIAAARTGASVVVLEKYGFPGGLATTAHVGTICGLYLRDKSDRTPVRSANGFTKEFSTAIAKDSESKPKKTNDGLYVLPYKTNTFIDTAIYFITREPNIRFGLHSTIACVKTNDKKITDVEALVWNKMVNFKPNCLVDTTGDATLLHLAGAELVEDRQAAAVIFSIKSLENQTFGLERQLSVIRDVARSVEKKGIV